MRSGGLNKLGEGGVIPAMPLVLDENRKFDEAGQRRLIRYYLEAGADGLAVAVHTTQFEIRDPEINLFETVLATAADEIKRHERESGQTVVKVAGTCGPTPQAVSEAELAKIYGYDAALLSPGGLNNRSESYMVDRTAQVADVLPVVGFYLQPAVGGRVFSYDYWARVCEIKNVAAIKCASFDRYLTLDVMRAVALSGRDDIAMYTGNDDSIVTDLMTEYEFIEGGIKYKSKFVGGLLGHWAVWTHSAKKYYDDVIASRDAGAIGARHLTLAEQVTDANGAFFDVHNNFAGCIAGVHEVLRRQGLMRGIWCLNPEETLSPGQAEEIDRVYAMYPGLNDDAFVRSFLERNPL